MKKEPRPKSKLVVRHLPAQLTEDAFLSEIEQFQSAVDFFYYRQGRISEKKTLDSVAYLNMVSEEALMAFAQFFDGHLFVTGKGKEMKASVEYAPFQKIPNKTKKKIVDKYANTIEEDPDFKKFAEELKNPVQLLPSAEEQLDKRLAEQKEAEAQPFTTPLLEYLKNKKSSKTKRGDRAERKKRAKERKDTKDTKKDDKKKRERVVVKKKEKETEKKKKKKEGAGVEGKPEVEQQDKKKGEPQPPKDNTKRQGKNGLWVVRKNLEPGAISIQPRESREKEASAPSHPLRGNAERVPHPNNPPPAQRGHSHAYGGGGRGKGAHSAPGNSPHPHSNPQQPQPATRGAKARGRGGAGGGARNEQQSRAKVYAPKQPATPAVVVNNGP